MNRVVLTVNSYTLIITPPGLDPIGITTPAGYNYCLPLFRSDVCYFHPASGACNLSTGIGSMFPIGGVSDGLAIDMAACCGFLPHNNPPPGTVSFEWAFAHNPITFPVEPYFYSVFSPKLGSTAPGCDIAALYGTYNRSGTLLIPNTSTPTGSYSVSYTLDAPSVDDCCVVFAGIPYRLSRVLRVSLHMLAGGAGGSPIVNPGNPASILTVRDFYAFYSGGAVWTFAVPVLTGFSPPYVVSTLAGALTLTGPGTGFIDAALVDGPFAGYAIPTVVLAPWNEGGYATNEFSLRMIGPDLFPPSGARSFVLEI